MKIVVAILFLVMAVIGCGVKGDPLPPEKPPEIGRGKPTYKRAMRSFEVKDELPEDEENDEDSESAEDEE